MVKFGRHLEFYTAHQLAELARAQTAYQQQQPSSSASLGSSSESHNLYVVPYNKIKLRCIPTYAAREKVPEKGVEKRDDDAKKVEEEPVVEAELVGPTVSQENERHRERDIALNAIASALTPDDVYFTIQKFKTDWRQCLANASRDFTFQTKKFWLGVFDGLEDAATDNHPLVIEAIQGQEGSSQVADMDFSENAPGMDLSENVPEQGQQTQYNIDPSDIRGALPDKALHLYLQISSPQQVQLLYAVLKNIHSTALINSEALRKLVKKFDKEMSKIVKQGLADEATPAHITERGTKTLRLSGKLLPEVYSANFAVGLPTVEAGLSVIRQHLGLDDDEDDEEQHLADVHAARIKFLAMDENVGNDVVMNDEDMKEAAADVAGFFGLTFNRARRDTDEDLVEKRKSELRWLRTLVEKLREYDAGIPKDENGGTLDMTSCLVGHRGFHSTKDKAHRRPLENSLMAYEAAWTNGINLCECDIALTRDERLILCHDENFVRLALDRDDPLVHKKVGDLTYKEIMRLPLKSGVRPPLLFDVLRSAAAIGGEARMIVEIKPGNIEAGTALARMFARYPHLMERCAVVMSFDAFAMQNLRRELECVFPTCFQPDPIASSNEIQNLVADTAAPAVLAAGPSQLPPRRVHRRGISLGGAPGKSQIPTAFSIGALNELIPTAAAQGVEAVPNRGLGLHSRNSSMDQLGLGLGLGLSPVDSSPFLSQFSKPNRVNSMTRLNSTPAVPQTQQAPTKQAPTKQTLTNLETIPGGVRVDDLPPHPVVAAEPIAATVTIPKLLLITRNGPAQNAEQKDALEVNITRMSDIDRAHAWLQGGSPSNRLDGLYMQFQECMLTPEGIQAMRLLTTEYSVGIWGCNSTYDEYETFSHLVQDCGVSYVNSGLPKKFMKQIRRNS